MMRQAEAREMPQVCRTTLQSRWGDAQPFGFASDAGQQRLPSPLTLKLFSGRSREKVDNRVAEVSIIRRIPRAIEEVEGATHRYGKVLQQRDKSTLRQKAGNFRQHHGGAIAVATTTTLVCSVTSLWPHVLIRS